ncbi:hypothetical protein ACTFIU_006538 [Dictyostelium citrinum]
MKLLLSLILVMTIALNCCKSFRLDSNKIDYSRYQNQEGQQQCFTSSGQLPTGYSSSYLLLSFNGNYPTASGIQQSSFLESGYIDIDFVNNGNTKTKGSFWGFGGNSTQYVSVELNGSEYCFQQPLTFSVPTLDGLKYATDFEIGTVQCDMFESKPSDIGNSSKAYLLVDKSKCSLISGSTENINNTPSGYTLTNYYYYTTSSNPSFFKLPNIFLENHPF